MFKTLSVLYVEPLLSQGPVGLSTPGTGCERPTDGTVSWSSGVVRFPVSVLMCPCDSTCYFSAMFSDHNGGSKLQLPRKDKVAWLPQQSGQRTLGWSLKD